MDKVEKIKAEIEVRYNECLKRAKIIDAEYWNGKADAYRDMLVVLDTLEVKEVDLKLENENNSPKITIGTKIRSKTNPDVILSIISDDCHEDEFECSNGSVLSLKQIEKYYDLV
jgi:hypothetical protein